MACAGSHNAVSSSTTNEGGPINFRIFPFVTSALLVLLLCAASGFAQTQPGIVQMLAPILQQAGQPLSDAQTQKLNALEPGPQMQQQMVEILTPEQLAILQQLSGQNQQPTIVEVLEQGENPITEEQMTEIQAIEEGPDARKQMMDILTDGQIVALREFMENQDGANVPKVLNDGGEPLSVEQMRKMNAINPGPDAEAELEQILTDSQNKLLEDARTANN